jgi:hypothetical protein
MRLLLVIAVSLVLCCVVSASDSAVASSTPVRFAVAFGASARLGDDTPMILELHVDGSLAPVTEFRLLTPPGVTFANSRLGAAECRRPQVEITRVMGPIEHGRCPGNSLLGVGTATAGLVLSEEQTLFGAAVIELHAGAPVGDRPGLLVTADTYRPVRLQLTYAGYLYVPPGPFGVGLAILVSEIPRPPFGAPVALSRLRLTVGGSSIQYHRSAHGRRTWYRPGGIPLPDACPRGGFRFRAILRFADATRRSVDALARCPVRRGQLVRSSSGS